MTNIRQVKKLLQPLMERHSDFKLVGNLLILTPVRHLARGIHIGRLRSREIFRPVWAINCLFEPREGFPYSFGGEIYPKQKGGWQFDIDGVEESLANCIEEEILPRLHATQTVQDFYEFAMKGPFFTHTLQYHPLRKIYVDTALGDFPAAQSIIEMLKKDQNEWSKMTITSEHLEVLIDILGSMIINRDRSGIAALLHEWEAASVKKLKLEKFWQPSPFPIEI